jgi:HPt (histidine-containing phosphotransfer) domain-containing protein
MPEPNTEEAPLTMIEEEDDDIYDDLLGAPEESFSEPELELETEPVLEVPSLNFDAQRAANELGIPADIVNEFVQEFKEQINSHKIDFDNAIAADDVVGIKKTATLLKGMSDNLRLNEISEVLKGLQQTTDTNTTAQDLATLQAYADQL